MRIDYSKNEYTLEERKYMRLETERLQESNPLHIPVLIQLDSNVLKMEKQKFLVRTIINFNDFINHTLKKKLINFYTNDTLIITIVKYSGPQKLIEVGSTFGVDLDGKPKTMIDIYNEYKDNETNLLIFRVSRLTNYKWAKSYVNYFTGL